MRENSGSERSALGPLLRQRPVFESKVSVTVTLRPESSTRLPVGYTGFRSLRTPLTTNWSPLASVVTVGYQRPSCMLPVCVQRSVLGLKMRELRRPCSSVGPKRTWLLPGSLEYMVPPTVSRRPSGSQFWSAQNIAPSL